MNISNPMGGVQLLREADIPNFRGIDLVDPDSGDEGRRCRLRLSGSYVNAIPNTVKFADTMYSKPDMDAKDEEFAPVSESNGRSL